MVSYMYQQSYNPLGYPPSNYQPPPGFYSFPPANDAGDSTFDPYSVGYPSTLPYPAPYPIYYPPIPLPRPYIPSSFRLQDVRNLRDEIEDMTERRAAGVRRARSKNLADESVPADLNPDSLKNMLYDTLQQEVAALEVLKQQIASFTLLTHTLEQNGRIRSESSEFDSSSTPQMSFPTREDLRRGRSEPRPVNFVPQFDSTKSANVYAGQGGKSQLASKNFINPTAFYSSPYHFPPTLHDQPYVPYSYPAYFSSISGQSNVQPSFVDLSNPSVGPTVSAPYSQASRSNNPYQPRSMSNYAQSFRRLPVNLVNSPLAADSYQESFHDLAIRTLYEVENKLKEAEETISEKINEFETEVSAQTASMAIPPALSVGYSPYYPQPYPTFESVPSYVPNKRKFSSDSQNDSSMVKELAVRALQAIDRRLRMAEKTIDSTVSNFDGMDAGRAAAVQSPTREIGVQTPAQRRSEYDSDTDDTLQARGSD